jgi:carbon-monoxide dehydrogenase medium subunit
VTLPQQPAGGAYAKFERRAGDFGVASAGVQIGMNGDRCESIAISLGAVGPVPRRAREAEKCIQGTAPSARLLAEAEQLVAAAADPIEDTRGSVEYKRHVAGVMFRRAFDAALHRARSQSTP